MGKMKIICRLKRTVCVVALLLLCGCATSNHGTFVTSTYAEPDKKIDSKVVGKVLGESTQTWILYIFPIGEPPSTDNAISNAIAKVEGTKFLTDLSVDDSVYWGIGFKKQIIRAQATARK